MIKKIQFAVLAVIFVSGCASQPKKEPVQAPVEVAEEEIRIDYLGLQRHLGLDRNSNELGYAEKTFDTCTVGYGFSSSRDCQQKRFATVNLRLQCRDSEGTISTGLAASDLLAISGKRVRWALNGLAGSAQTDGEGYAQIAGIFSTSPKQQRLRIAVGTQFLYMRAGDITRVVVPKPWCE
ncbi:MAG: hypothetical protein V4692_04195 [Bdellovibrionota bacterium]